MDELWQGCGVEVPGRGLMYLDPAEGCLDVDSLGVHQNKVRAFARCKKKCSQNGRSYWLQTYH